MLNAAIYVPHAESQVHFRPKTSWRKAPKLGFGTLLRVPWLEFAGSRLSNLQGSVSRGCFNFAAFGSPDNEQAVAAAISPNSALTSHM